MQETEGNESLPLAPHQHRRPVVKEASSDLSRRDMLQTTGTLAAASALSAMAIPQVHAAENNTIRVALVGCGGRGTGAAENALSTRSGPIELVAMADVF